MAKPIFSIGPNIFLSNPGFLRFFSEFYIRPNFKFLKIFKKILGCQKKLKTKIQFFFEEVQ